MARKLGVALIGTGNIALMHTLGYKNFPDAEIRAICDLNVGRAKSFQEETELPSSVKIYKSSAECVKDDSIDMVEILTPHKSHEPLVIEAAEAGKHISVQKPPAMTLSSYDRMVSAADKAGVRFRVYENFRYHPPYVKAFELIKQGVIGRVEVVNIRMWNTFKGFGEYRGSKWRFPKSTLLWKKRDDQCYKAPTMFDDGYHKQSMIQGFLGDLPTNFEPVTAVRSWVGWQKIKKVVKVDMPAVTIYETKKASRYGTWNANYVNALPLHSNYFSCEEYLEITGRKGIIIVPGCTGNLFIGCDCGGPGQPGTYWFSQDEGKEGEAGTWKADCSMETDWSYSFIDCTRHFASLLAKDEWFDDSDPRPLQAEKGRQILAISLAMIRSLRVDGNKVNVKDIKDAP
jgi:predicted dehydrogenase